MSASLAVVAASEPVFDAIKLAGAAYLVVLGLQSLRDAVRRRARVERLGQSGGAPRAFRQGLLSNLGNPKRVLDAVVGVFSGLAGPAPGDRAALALPLG